MNDAPGPERPDRVHAMVATGAAALFLIVGTIAILVGLGFVLKAFGYGVMLLVAVGVLLLGAAIVDLRRKRLERRGTQGSEESG